MTKTQKVYAISILTIAYMLVAFGIVMNLSVSPSQSSASELAVFYRYLLSVGVGTVLMFIFAVIDPDIFKRFAFPLFLFFLILLFFTKPAPNISMERNSSRWISFGHTPFSLQPSQYVSFALAAFVAKVLSIKDIDEKNKKLYYTVLFVFALIAVAKVGLEPDLGTAFIIFATFVLLLFGSGVDLGYILLSTGATTLLGAIVVLAQPSHSKRIAAFFHPEKYSLNSGYQALQSFKAIASGGIYGVGLTRSYFKYGSLPENGKDFIFSIIGEETGLIGETILITLYLLFAYVGLKIVYLVQDKFRRILALGIVLNIIIGVIVNIAANVGLFPVVGVPLPFVSYSGNNIVVSFMEVGVLISIIRKEVE